MRNWKFLFTVIFLAILIVGGIFIISTLSLKSNSKPNIRIAQIEMREYDIASKVPGRIEWILVDEGDVVTEGMDIFKLTDREVRAKVNQAKGAVESASAQFSMANKGARPEQIKMAEKNYNAAFSQYELAKSTLNRMKKLFDERLISDQELDVVSQKVTASLSMMEAAKSQYDMALNGSRSEEKLMAKGQYDRAKESLEEANAYFDETIVKSLYNGIISKRYVDKGELVSTGYPVVSVIDTSDVWAELNIPATELEKIKIGQRLKGRINGLGVEETFVVANFSQMADFANWRSTSDKNTFDIRTFSVKLKPVKKNISSLRPGMTVTFKLLK